MALGNINCGKIGDIVMEFLTVLSHCGSCSGDSMANDTWEGQHPYTDGGYGIGLTGHDGEPPPHLTFFSPDQTD